MPSDVFTHTIADLRTLGGQRVWSLMVSLFGDLAQAEGAGIDGPVLSRIMTAMQIRPEATRVALHRLRNDGWIASEKRGRISRHTLTPHGRKLSAEASPVIYADPYAGPEEWSLVLLPPDATASDALGQAGYIQIMPRLYAKPPAASLPAGALELLAKDAPPWLREAVEPAWLAEDYAALARTLGELTERLPRDASLSAVETAVLRCLVVHNWRRLVLKHNWPPRALVSPDWAGHRAHILVADLLQRFPRPSLSDIGCSRN